jgi:transcription-repair coupling factor (superfamily II helicase)
VSDPLLFPPAPSGLTALFERLRAGESSQVLGGVSGSAAALCLSFLGREIGQRIFLVCPDDSHAEKLAADLRSLQEMTGAAGGVHLFPALGADPYQGLPPHPRAAWERVEFLRRLESRDDPGLFLCSGLSLLQPLTPPGTLGHHTLTVREWQEISLERFAAALEAGGYQQVDLVTQRGEWSRRGGILDIHPAGRGDPVRIELYGDQVESIRGFDPLTQRSREKLEAFEIPPIRELSLSRDNLERLIPILEGFDRHAREAGVESRAEALRNRGYFMGVEALAALVHPARHSVFDYLGPEALIVVMEPALVEETVREAWSGIKRRFGEETEPALPPPERLYLAPGDILPGLEARRLAVEELPDPEDPGLVPIEIRTHPAIAGGIPQLLDRIRDGSRQGWWQILVAATPGRLQRMQEILSEENLPIGEIVGGAGGGILLRRGSLLNGFDLPADRLAVFNEEELFGAARRAVVTRKGRAAFHADFRDLHEGDLVVHAEHGIGRFLGLDRLGGNGPGNGELLVLEYREGDRLYLPVFRLDLLQRYTGSGGTAPRLDRLGGRTWEKTRNRVRKAMREMAEELLKLYAARKVLSGIRFPPDGPWQKEVEDAFPFDETPDQARAIEEVKRDMEQEGAMDRLLCGDVGFGKTEVAIRSAFKAVMDGRQVAILVPTTVLAFQHFRTFSERFSAFPVRVGMLSRFRSRAEQKQTMEDLTAGRVDVVIGTHRLLSGDVRFHNLGLLVIDEEQRFGVKHKERIKGLRRNVDVLTMTATPIPRTLQMSLAGIRDLSVIETPPRDRLEIQTSVVPFREGILAAAIRTELGRGGQVYFVHNRVESIASMAHLIRRICPEVRIGIAHGQMRENQLERTMLAFVEGEFDLLLSTTIIENGLDIPNVNTLIVNRSDRFGLSQLYQLRGRVGRSHHRAYAYFLVPSYRILTEAARKRLRVLREFTQLGSGFRIAAMDLEIRGAGHVLGAQQHGHIGAVGFDTYVKLLENAVRELRGEKVVAEVRPELNLRIDYTLPEDYISDRHQRLFLYKKISSARSEEEVDDIRREAVDAYGRMPVEGDLLFELARLRILAAAVRVKSIEWSAGALRFRFGEVEPEVRSRLVDRISRQEGWRLTPDGVLIVPTAADGGGRIEAAGSVLKGLN